MQSRIRYSILVLVAVCTVLAPSAPSGIRAQNAGATQLDVVKVAYDNLLGLYYRPLDPAELMYAAWDGLSNAVSQANLRAPQPLQNVPSTRGEAFSTFSTAYGAYLAGLPDAGAPRNFGFAAAQGMAASLHDDHTSFLSPAAYNSFLGALGGGELPVGLGLTTTNDAPWTVTAVAPNGPAAQAGIAAGDVVLSSDGIDFAGTPQRSLASATGGPAGTLHKLRLQRGSTRIETTITRGTYYFPPITSSLMDGSVGYISITHFADAGLPLPDGTEIIAELDRRLSQLDAQGARGLVLDLRGNPGGDTLAAEEVVGRFLPPSERTVTRFDQRGHQATGMVAGPMHAIQLPMVVLVDGGSASSSEVVASTLKEANRVLLVGQQTAGALATSEVLPLPAGAGLQVSVAQQITARTGYQIDGVGYPVDVNQPDTRTSDDYRAGRDPQLQAAIAALSRAPLPPPVSSESRISKSTLSDLLSSYMPAATQIPTNDRLTSIVQTESLNLNQPNEWLDVFGLGGRDPYQGQQALLARGWIGSHVQNYNLAPLVPPGVSVVVDLYETEAGAINGLQTNDFPDQQEFIAPPLQLGDGTVAARGIWISLGSTAISWRRGSILLSVGYGDVPGQERTDVMLAVAKLVDDAFRARPLAVPTSASLPTESLSDSIVRASPAPLDAGHRPRQAVAKSLTDDLRPDSLEFGLRILPAAPQPDDQRSNAVGGACAALKLQQQPNQYLRVMDASERVLQCSQRSQQPVLSVAQNLGESLQRITKMLASDSETVQLGIVKKLRWRVVRPHASIFPPDLGRYNGRYG